MLVVPFQKGNIRCLSFAYMFLGKLSFIVFLLYFPFITNAQLNHVVLNEVSGDGGNIEARNDAIVELAGPPGTDIGCMVITNTEWAVVLPANTTIPADGVFLIACGIGNNGGYGVYSGTTTGLSCATCDFWGLPIDFDVCNAANANYVSSSMYTSYGFTLDNGYCGNNRDGDQVILFQANGSVHDAIYWGAADPIKSRPSQMTYGGASGNCASTADHISVQIGQAYTLGDNDENGVVNDYLGTHVGYKANGGNATAVNSMPTGNDDLSLPFLFEKQLNIPPGDCNAHRVSYTVPAITDPVWVDVGLALVGCNSTHIRLKDPVKNSVQGTRPFTKSSHRDDPDLNDNWMGYAVEQLIPSGIDPVLAKDQWRVTNHPNPGAPNDVDTWDFFYDTGNGKIEITEAEDYHIILCEPQSITFELKVYNYQQVEKSTFTGQKAGSFIRDENGIDQTWTVLQEGNIDGVTEMQFTTNTLAFDTQNSLTLVWDDYTDCCGSGSPDFVINAANPNECYESLNIHIQIAEPLRINKNRVDCPGDYEIGAGLIDFSSFVTSPSAIINYQLKEMVTLTEEETTGRVVATSKTGMLHLSSSLQTPIAVIIEDLSKCGNNQVINIGADCRNTPPCPNVQGASINTNTICPAVPFILTIDGALSTDLPIGGQIDWHFGHTSDFDPSDPSSTGYIGVLPNASKIEDAGKDCPIDGAAVFISELYDPLLDWDCHRYIEIYNGGPCPQDLSGWTLAAIGNNKNVITFALSGTIEVGQAMIASASCATEFTPDFFIPDQENWRGGSMGLVNGQSKDGAILYDATGKEIDIAVINTADNNNWFMDKVAVRRAAICVGFTQGNTLCDTEADCTNLQAHWETLSTDAAATPQTHIIEASACREAPFRSFVAEIENTFDGAYCNQQLYIKGIVNPAMVIDGVCNQSNFTTAALPIKVVCPEANLVIKDINLCQPIEEDLIVATVNLSGGSGTYHLVFEIMDNGTTSFIHRTNIQHPFHFSYGDLVAALGKKEFSNIELKIASVEDEAGALCLGQIAEEIIILTTQQSVDVTITNSQLIPDCTSNTTGNLTIDLSPKSGGPWEITYQLDQTSPKTITTNTTPFILPITQAGNYKLLQLVNEAGCSKEIVDQNKQVLMVDQLLQVRSVSEALICKNNEESVNLDTDISIEIEDADAIISGNSLTMGNIKWYREDPYDLPEVLKVAMELEESNKIVSPIISSDYYFTYTKSDNCEAYGKARVEVVEICCPTITATLIGATHLQDCQATASGGILIDISPINSGPWSIQYQLEEQVPLEQIIVESPYNVPVSEAGNYQLLSVQNLGACMGTLGDVVRQTVLSYDSPIALHLPPTQSICGREDATPINLMEDIPITIEKEDGLRNGNAIELGNISWHHQNPLSVREELRLANVLLSPIVKPTSTTSFFCLYEDPNTGCMAVGQTTIQLDNTLCMVNEETVDKEEIVVPTFSQWALFLFLLIDIKYQFMADER